MKNLKMQELFLIFIFCFTTHFVSSQSKVTVDDMAGGLGKDFDLSNINMRMTTACVTDTVNNGMYFTGGFVKNKKVPVLKWDGKAWTQCGEGFKGVPECLVMFKGELYAAGLFIKVDEMDVKGFAKWDGKKWSAVTLPQSFVLPSISAMCVYKNELYVGGSNGSSSKPSKEIKFAKFDGQKGDPLGEVWSKDDGSVSKMCVYKDELVVGGDFGKICGNEIDAVALYNGSTWRSAGLKMKKLWWADAGGLGLTCLTVFKGDLYLGGNFWIGDYNGICKWDGTQFSAVGKRLKGVPSQNLVEEMVVYKNELVIFGHFEGPDETDSQNIIQWDGEKFIKRLHEVEYQPTSACVYNKGIFVAGTIVKITTLLPNGKKGTKVEVNRVAMIKY